MADLTIDVIVATYGDDSWKHLAEERALPSVYNQTDRDGVRIIQSHEPTLAAARNIPAFNSEADYIVFLDADDELDHRYIASARMALAATYGPDGKPGAHVLVPNVSYVNPDGTAEPPAPIEPRPWASGNHVVVGAPVVTRLFQYLKGFQDWDLYEDWDLWWRASEAGAVFVHVPNMVYRYWRTPGGRNEPGRADKIRTKTEIRRAHGVMRGG